MTVLFNQFLQNAYSKYSVQANQPVVQAQPLAAQKVDMSQPKDTFVKAASPNDVYMQKLNALFPNGALDEIYAQMGKELGIDVMPELKFYGPSDKIAAGGFTYHINQISLSLSEIFDNDQKVVMVKNGMYKVLMSPEKLPSFIDKANGEMFVNAQREHFKTVVDDLKLMPMNDNDFRKFVIQKLSHELIHAQQHMVMRSTEGIGEKEIFKAWTHLLPENEADEKKLAQIVEDNLKNSFWANKTPTVAKHKKDSEIGKLGYVWLEAIRKYPPVDSPEYKTNAVEVDAYNRSYEYIVKNFGGY